jgi:hypothetical protein
MAPVLLKLRMAFEMNISILLFYYTLICQLYSEKSKYEWNEWKICDSNFPFKLEEHKRNLHCRVKSISETILSRCLIFQTLHLKSNKKRSIKILVLLISANIISESIVLCSFIQPKTEPRLMSVILILHES